MAARPGILIVGREEIRLRSLASGLDELGMVTTTARGPFAAMACLADLSIAAAIVDLEGAGAEAASIARRLKAASAPRRLPVIALAGPGVGWDAPDFDLILAPPLHLAPIAARLETLIRLAVAEEEFELRAQTFAEYGCRLAAPADEPGPARVLTVGEPAPRFLSLSRSLETMGAEVVAAFTAYTAFDYLQDSHFDAVALWAGADRRETLQIAAGMRRNTRLFHIPALLCVGDEDPPSAAEVFQKGISEISPRGEAEEEIACRLISLARAHRRQNAVRAALIMARDSPLMDASTGLFTGSLFASHLTRLAHSAQARNRPFSLCVHRVGTSAAVVAARRERHLDPAIAQIGSMIGRLVRVEDTAARLGAEVFAVAMPDTSGEDAQAAAERIAAVIACTAFEAGPGRPPFVVHLENGAAQVRRGQSAARALEAAALRATALQAS